MRKSAILILLFFISCKQDTIHVPKPRMYPRIDYPEKSYKPFHESYCKVVFEMPEYASVIRDTTFFEGEPLHSCWFDLIIPSLDGRIHFSYYPVENRKQFDGLVEDAFTFVEKHDLKANFRGETNIKNDQGLSGILFEIDGPVASGTQFYLTDSTEHFIRASLYFNHKTIPDSIAPIEAFVKEDIKKIIETLDFGT